MSRCADTTLIFPRALIQASPHHHAAKLNRLVLVTIIAHMHFDNSLPHAIDHSHTVTVLVPGF